jgi:hypothetical protein
METKPAGSVPPFVEEIVERARGVLLVLTQPRALSENGGEVVAV